MRQFADIDEKDFEALVADGGNLRGLQILQGALTAGVASFGMVVVVLYGVGMGAEGQAPAGEQSLLPVLTLVHAVVALSSWCLAFLLHSLVLKKGGATRDRRGAGSPSEPPADPAGRLMDNLRGATILRLAILEGAALLGLVICLLGVLGGEIREQPVYWLNSLSAFAFLVFSAWTFPTEGRLMDTFREIKRSARHGG